MKSLRSAVQICLFLCLLPISTGFASASTVTLSGNILFSSLDGSAQDSDGLANGVFTVNGDLVVNGTINCNDDLSPSGSAGACPIRITASGDLLMRAGSGIFAENRRGAGAAGSILLTVGGNLTLRGPSGSLPGAIVSSSRLSNAAKPAGSTTASVHGDVTLEAGSTVAASTPNGSAGTIRITADGKVAVAGLVASGPGRQVLGTKLTGKILDDGKSTQSGGAILIRSNSSAGPGVRVENSGTVVSQGEVSGSQMVLLEGCGLEIRGLVASLLKGAGPSQVVLRSGKGILVDGRDLGVSGPTSGRGGRVRADGVEGGSAGYMVDLFAQGDIQVLGPASSLAAVSSSPGTQTQRSGGAITAISLTGGLTAAGNAFEAGKTTAGNQGGIIDLQAKGNATLDGATLRAVGDSTTSASSRKGGRLSVRSFQGALSWTFGLGDVRPVGAGTPASTRGTINLTACAGIDTTGTQFPTVGAPILPFPTENNGVCSPAAPTLPSGEPPLPVCNQPPVADSQTVLTDEDTPVTITLTGSDPNGQPLTFTIVTPPAHGSLGPLTSPTATSVQVVYTPALDYNGPDAFTFQVDDGNGGTSTATVTLSVKPINDAPKVDAATFTVNENAPNGTVVGTATFTDPDTGQAHTFAITAGNTAGAFAINPTTGQITVANSSALDFETNPSFSLTVQVTDDGSPVLSDTAAVTINLADTSEPPVVNPATFAVAENSPNGTGVGTVTFTDGDTGQTHTFSILGGNTGGTFAIDPSTGVITVANSAALDFETTPTFSLTVQVTDSGSQSGTATITINVSNLNEAPVVHPATFAVNENSPIGTVLGTVTFTDPDAGQSHTFAITGGNTGGAFAIDPSTGQITVAGGINYEVTPSFSLTVQVTDGGSPSLSGSATITIGVNDVNEPPVAGADSYNALGNTQLRVAGAPGTGLLGTTAATGVLANDSDPDNNPAFKNLTLVAATGTSANGGDYSLASDGSFSYTPPAGFTGNDTFTYTLSDGDNTATGTVTVTVSNRVWYVRDIVDERNAAGGDGRSTDAFDSIAALNAATTNNGDIIFIFRGNTGTTPLTGGITLKDGQKLWGEGIGLTVAPFGTLVAAGAKPKIDNTGGDAVSVPATAGNRQNVEIRGLDFQGSGNAVDVTASGANLVGITISDNNVSSAGLEGIDLNAGSTGAFTATLNNNDIAATGNAFDARTSAASALTIDFSNNAVVSNANGIVIDGSGGGTTTITGFANNGVSGNTVGTGISIASAGFDLVPGTGTYDQVLGGLTVIGTSASGVGGSGMVLSNVSGNLAFANLDIFADGGAGLRVTGTGAFIGSAGMQIAVVGGVAVFEANGGPAVDVTNATINLQPASVKSTNSPTMGLALNTVNGTFSAGSSSSITNAAGTAFQVGNSNATISYAGTINATTSKGVDLTNNAGSTIGFTGTLTLSTGTNPAFTATGGGTVTSTDTASTLTTMTATALNVANTNIGASGLKFRSINAGTAASGPANGIVLNTTGALGGLTVSGTGSAGSGGTIQKTTGPGISLTGTANVNLSSMNIQNGTDDGINGSNVTGFSLAGSNITANGDSTTDEGLELRNLAGTASITNTNVTGSAHNNFFLDNTSGTLTSLTISNSTFNNNSTANGNHGFLFQARGTSVISAVDITGSTFSGNKSIGMQILTADTATVTAYSVSTSTFTNQQIAMDFSQSQTSNLAFKILNNTNITGQNSHAINVFTAAGAGTGGTLQGRIENNIIGNAGVVNSGSAIGNCMRVNINGQADASVLINGNTLRQCPNGRGIEVIGRNGTGGLDVTVTGNDVNPQDISGAPLAAILVQSNCLTTCNTVRSDVRGNTVPGGASTDLLPTYIALVKTGASTSQLVDTAPASPDCTSQLTSTNTGSASANAGCALIAGPISTPP
ncbi:MAG: cadherin domain-containing protein [Thermoanaerobaculia bacterium]